MERTLLPHKNLDWALGHHESKIRTTPEDQLPRIEFARTAVSKFLYHGGETASLKSAIKHLRSTMTDLACQAKARPLMAICLVGVNRLSEANEVIESLTNQKTMLSRFALSIVHQANGDLKNAVQAAEEAISAAPDQWEPQVQAARCLAAIAASGPPASHLSDRLLLHLTRALKKRPEGPSLLWLREQAGLHFISKKHYDKAQKLFEALLNDAASFDGPRRDDLLVRAWFQLGIITIHLGKHTNALTYFRNCLARDSSNPDVHAWIARAHLHLSEHRAARRSCQNALVLAPDHVLARLVLGCARAEEGDNEEALKVLKGLLADAPQMTQVFSEIVQIRSNDGKIDWLFRALRSEVKRFESMSIRKTHMVPSYGMVEVYPRATTFTRIDVLLSTLRGLGIKAVEPIIEAMDLTTDEGLRYHLWDSAVELMAIDEASNIKDLLTSPSDNFSRDAATQILLLADYLHIDALFQGLTLTVDDLTKVALARKGNASDISVHRGHIEQLREEARVWQAMVLLALGRHAEVDQTIMRQWAETADPDLSTASSLSLAMLGGKQATNALYDSCDQPELKKMVGILSERASSRTITARAGIASAHDNLCCRSCGTSCDEVRKMIKSSDTIDVTSAICSDCLLEVAEKYDDSVVEFPDATCSLCGLMNLASVEMLRINGCDLCSTCVQFGLSRLYRA